MAVMIIIADENGNQLIILYKTKKCSQTLDNKGKIMSPYQVVFMKMLNYLKGDLYD